MTDGMSLGRQQAGQLAGTLTGPPERGHGIASGIRVNQSFQRLDQLGVVLDQRLPSSSRVPYSLNGERWLSKALDSPIDGRTRESGKTGDAGNTPSSQLLCIDGSDKVLLPLIQVRKQQAVFLLEFFSCAHTNSVTQRASFVTIINVRDLKLRPGSGKMCIAPGPRRAAFIAAGLLNLHVRLPFWSAHLAAVSQRRFPGFSGLHAHVRDGRCLSLFFRNRFGCWQGERIRNDPFAPLDAGDHFHEVGVTDSQFDALLLPGRVLLGWWRWLVESDVVLAVD